MNSISIKEETSDSLQRESIPTSSSSFSNLSPSYALAIKTSRNVVSQCSASVPPTQVVLPSTISSRIVDATTLGAGSAQETELLDKVNKLLCMLVSFGEGIAVNVGAEVRRNVATLVVGSISVPEFLQQLQLATTIPVRPFVLPFLQSNIHKLREEVQRLAMAAECSPSTYLLTNESLLEPSENQQFIPAANEIFQCETADSKSSGSKRKNSPEKEDRSKHPRIQPSQTSPPLLQTGPSFPLYKLSSNLAMVSGYPHEPQAPSQDAGPSQEDEWKNIKVMLNCICGMVEKTQSAISILQQRQSETVNIRVTEELVAEVQTKAKIAIIEVKEAALEEIKHAEQQKNRKVSDTQNDSKEESCWNCGRQATETCSGCSLARYCGPFCQHKDWEDHARVCRPDLTMEDHSRQQRGMAGSPPPRADTPSRKE